MPFSEQCSTRSPSRWAPAGGTGYYAGARYGNEEDEFLYWVAGLAPGEDGRLYVFDSGNSVVRAFDEQLKPLFSFGRRGRGPGEFIRFPSTSLRSEKSPSNWITTNGTDLFVFDGLVVSRFSPSGEFVDYAFGIGPGVLNPRSVDGFHSTTDAVYAFVRSFGVGSPTYTYYLIEMTEAGVDTILSHQLPDLPIGERGGTWSPAGQARPITATSGQCFFISDGYSPWLWRFVAGTRLLDSMPLPTAQPQVRPRDLERRQPRPLQGFGVAEAPSPTVPRIWADIAVDPDGFVWLRPEAMNADTGGVSVFIINPAEGTYGRRELVNFPRLFGPPGAFYGRKRDDVSGVPVLVRYDLSSNR